MSSDALSNKKRDELSALQQFHFRLIITTFGKPVMNIFNSYRRKSLVNKESKHIELRAFHFHKRDFIFDHIISIGLKSGLYGGRYNTDALTGVYPKICVNLQNSV